jgi:hypothetical protein
MARRACWRFECLPGLGSSGNDAFQHPLFRHRFVRICGDAVESPETQNGFLDRRIDDHRRACDLRCFAFADRQRRSPPRASNAADPGVAAGRKRCSRAVKAGRDASDHAGAHPCHARSASAKAGSKGRASACAAGKDRSANAVEIAAPITLKSATSSWPGLTLTRGGLIVSKEAETWRRIAARTRRAVLDAEETRTRRPFFGQTRRVLSLDNHGCIVTRQLAHSVRCFIEILLPFAFDELSIFGPPAIGPPSRIVGTCACTFVFRRSRTFALR